MPKKSTRGRPPVGEVPLTERVMIRATPDQAEAWSAAAGRAGFWRQDGKPNVGAWLRSVAERYVKRAS